MKYKMYRICLLMVAVAATTGGILYYCMCEKNMETSGKGTLVDQMQNTGSKVKRVGKHVINEVANAVEQTGHEMKEAAVATGYEWKHAAKAVGREFKDEFGKNSSEQV